MSVSVGIAAWLQYSHESAIMMDFLDEPELYYNIMTKYHFVHDFWRCLSTL